MTGTGQPVPGGVVATLAATIALDSLQMNTNFISITNTASISAVTVTTGLVPAAGGQLYIQFNQYTGGSGALTFSTGFRSTGTVTPTSAKAIIVAFVSDGTTYNEYARAASV